MKSFFQRSCLLMLLLLVSAAVPGCRLQRLHEDDPAAQDAFAYARRLGRGMNLGNALEAPTEGAWGITIQPEYFELIRKAGFDSVRIPIRWSAHAGAEPPYAVSDAFFRRIDEILDSALAHELAVVINIHHYEELMKDPAAHLPRFLALWRQISERYRNHPAALSFELLNEPADTLNPALWNEYLRHGLAAVRESNPTRVLIIGTAEWGGLRALDQLELPESDRNLIVTFHYYEPFSFTHQGAEWVGNSDRWMGTTWEGTPPEKQAVVDDFDRAMQWAAFHERPLYMGEFGAYRKAEMDARVRWTAFVAREAEARGIPWAYWEFCSGFGVFDAEAKAWRKPLLDALTP